MSLIKLLTYEQHVFLHIFEWLPFNSQTNLGCTCTALHEFYQQNCCHIVCEDVALMMRCVPVAMFQSMLDRGQLGGISMQDLVVSTCQYAPESHVRALMDLDYVDFTHSEDLPVEHLMKRRLFDCVEDIINRELASVKCWRLVNTCLLQGLTDFLETVMVNKQWWDTIHMPSYFQEACKYNNFEFIRVMLEHRDGWHVGLKSDLLCTVAHICDLNNFHRAMELLDVRGSDDDQALFTYVCAHGLIEHAEWMLNNTNVDPNFRDCVALRHAIECNQSRLAHMLVHHPRTPAVIRKIFRTLYDTGVASHVLRVLYRKQYAGDSDSDDDDD